MRGGYRCTEAGGKRKRNKTRGPVHTNDTNEKGRSAHRRTLFSVAGARRLARGIGWG